MATITGFTAARMKQIEDKSVIGGSVNNMGNLILMTRDGGNIDAGHIKGDPGIQGDAGIIGGSATQRDSYFGTPTTVTDQVALANRAVSWFNVTLGWFETYRAVTGSVGLTVPGAPASTGTGWYPLRQGAQPYGHMGRTAGFQALSGLTTVQMDAAQTLVGGITFDNAADSLIVPTAGYYRITAQAYFSGTIGGDDIGHIFHTQNGVDTVIARSSVTPTSVDSSTNLSAIKLASAGDKFRLSLLSGGQQAWGTDGFNGCWLDVAWYMAP